MSHNPPPEAPHPSWVNNGMESAKIIIRDLLKPGNLNAFLQCQQRPVNDRTDVGHLIPHIEWLYMDLQLFLTDPLIKPAGKMYLAKDLNPRIQEAITLIKLNRLPYTAAWIVMAGLRDGIMDIRQSLRKAEERNKEEREKFSQKDAILQELKSNIDILERAANSTIVQVQDKLNIMDALANATACERAVEANWPPADVSMGPYWLIPVARFWVKEVARQEAWHHSKKLERLTWRH